MCGEWGGGGRRIDVSTCIMYRRWIKIAHSQHLNAKIWKNAINRKRCWKPCHPLFVVSISSALKDGLNRICGKYMGGDRRNHIVQIKLINPKQKQTIVCSDKINMNSSECRYIRCTHSTQCEKQNWKLFENASEDEKTVMVADGIGWNGTFSSWRKLIQRSRSWWKKTTNKKHTHASNRM